MISETEWQNRLQAPISDDNAGARPAHRFFF